MSRSFFDTSAWNRQRDPSVAPRWQAALTAGLLAICPVVALELLAAARDEDAFRHFEPLARVLGTESILVAPRGSLD